jgi:hypothetical protein
MDGCVVEQILLKMRRYCQDKIRLLFNGIVKSPSAGYARGMPRLSSSLTPLASVTLRHLGVRLRRVPLYLIFAVFSGRNINESCDLLILRHCGVQQSMPHSSGIASLAIGAFYLTAKRKPLTNPSFLP